MSMSQPEAPQLFHPDTFEAFPEVLPVIDNATIEGLSFEERLEVLQTAYGFIPDSSRELSEALSAVSSDNGARGAAKHLGEIHGHQERTKPGSGFSATSSVAKEYIGYFRSSMSQVTHLAELRESLIGINPRIDALEQVNPTTTGAAVLANYVHRMNLLDRPNREGSSFAAVDLNDNLVIGKRRTDEVASELRGLTVADALNLTGAAKSNHEARREFWRQRLVEVEAFTPVANMVARALRSGA